MHNYAVPGFFIVLAVILVTGILGGIRNWLTEDLKSEDRNILLYKRILDAVIAASTIPLFLTVVGNEKTKSAFGEPDIWSADYHLALFILVGFCGLAAVFSQRFLNSLSTQVMRLSDKVDEATREAEQAKAITEPYIESEASEMPAPQTAPLEEALGADELKVLRALTSGQFLVRSRSGLLTTTGLPLEQLHSALEALEKRGLARKIVTDKGERWSPTDAGRSTAART